ncbi:MAG: HAMP domain-containing sensor histidine kinase [Blastocatellia bacterium]
MMHETLSHESNKLTEHTDEFLAMVSHELRTPIMAILGWIELLNHMPADQVTVAQAVSVIKRNAQLQAQLVDELMDYSSITANKFSLTTRRLALGPIIKAAVEALVPMARKKSINLEVELAALESETEGDGLRLQQVFSNLLSNAIKFTPFGGTVKVRLEDSDVYHKIIVSDTGAGISAEFLPFIFDRYRQARPATASGGLGLGLTIAHHIIELHGGTITADSCGAGQGAVFTVQLPRMQSGQ